MSAISIYDQSMQVRFKYGTKWIVAIVSEVAHVDVSLAVQWALKETMDPGKIPAQFLLGLASVFQPLIRIKAEPVKTDGLVLVVDCKEGQIMLLVGTHEVRRYSFFDWLTADTMLVTLEAQRLLVS